MDINTVSASVGTASVIARVSDEGESLEALLAESQRLGDQGVKTIVFPHEQMLISWRLRIEALA